MDLNQRPSARSSLPGTGEGAPLGLAGWTRQRDLKPPGPRKDAKTEPGWPGLGFGARWGNEDADSWV